MRKSTTPSYFFVLVLVFAPTLVQAFPLCGTLRTAEGRPIVGGRAVLEPLSANRAAAAARSEATLGSVTTDELGRFHMEVDRVGVYRLRLEADGFLPAERSPLVMAGGEEHLAPITLIPLGSEESMLDEASVKWNTPELPSPNVPRSTEPGVFFTPASTRGMVTDGHGRPVIGAVVWPGWDPGHFTVTDVEGRFVLPSAPGGRPWIQAQAPGFYPRTVDVDSGPIQVRLSAGAMVRGRVTDAEGRGLAGARLVAIPLGPVPRAFSLDRGRIHTSTDAEGGYTLRGLSRDTVYTIRAERYGFLAAERPSGNFASPAQGSHTGRLVPGRDGLDLILAASRGARGRVLAAPATGEDGRPRQPLPIADAVVRLRPSPDPHKPSPGRGATVEEAPVTVTSDSDGFFHVEQVPTFRLDVEISATGFAPMVLRGLPVESDAAHVADLGTVQLVRAATIRGVVTDDEGTGIAGVDVWLNRNLERDPARGVAKLEGDPPARTAPDGTFSLDELTPGERLHLVFTAPGFLAATREAVEAPREGLTVTLTPAANLAGRVLDEHEAPVANAKVSLVPYYADPGVMTPRLGPEHMHSIRTDTNGAFAFDKLTPALYKLSVHAAGYLVPPQRELEITRPGKKGLEIVLSAGAGIEGWITRPGGEPVADVRVSTQTQITQSADDGYYRLTGLPVEEEFTVKAYHASSTGVSETLELGEGELIRLDLELPGGHPVSGQVVAENGGGVEDVEVVLQSDMGRNSHRYQVLSDAGGRFQVDEVARGVYRLTAIRRGYATVVIENAVRVGDAAPEELEVVLPPGATVRGEVRGLELDVLQAVRIEARHDEDGLGAGRSQWGSVDAFGRYEVPDLGPGDWTIRAAAPGGTRHAKARVAIAPGELEAERDLDFDVGLTVRGQVLLRHEPLAGVTVSFRGHDVAERSRRVRTDHEGRYRLEALQPGLYRVSASKGSELMHYNRDLRIDADTELTIEVDSAEISGQVVDASSGRPLYARVTAQQYLISEEVSPERRASSAYSLPTSREGTFRMTGLTAGFYHLQVMLEGYAPYETELDLTGGSDPAPLQIALEPTRKVEFLVQTSDGRPLPRWVWANVFTAAGELMLSESGTVGADGRVSFNRIPDGRWRLFLVAMGAEKEELEIDVPGEAQLHGEAQPVVFAPAGSLRLRVPALVETDQVASAVLVDAAGRALRDSDGTTSWRLAAGRGVIDWVPSGTWNVRVTATDGQQWVGEVITPGTGEIAVELQ